MKLICLALVATVAMSAELRLTNAGGACSLRKQGSTVLSTCDFSTRTTSLNSLASRMVGVEADLNAIKSRLTALEATDVQHDARIKAKAQKGETGATGATGAQGQKGSTGAKGNTGAKGATGATGARGANGSNGSNGAKGQKGQTGATGATGARGANGSNGSNGAKGQKGETGVKPVGDSIVMITPQNIRTTCRSNSNTRQSLNVPSRVPTNAKAVLVSLTTYDSSRNDHVVHSFGRFNGHDRHTWDNRVYDLNTYLNDVMVTHEGDTNSDSGYYYGNSYGGQMVPIVNGQIKAELCMGHNNRGDSYITMQVYAYVPHNSGIEFVKTPQNIRSSCNGNGQRKTLSVPGVPSTAKAVFATVTTYNDHRNDHIVFSFGRNNDHTTHTWDNRVYDLNTRLNDILLTHEGDSSGDFYYGHSFGTQTIPMTGGTIQMNGCMGHSRGTTYVTLEVYGYIPGDSKDVYFITPQNIRTRGRGCRTSKHTVPSNVPTNAVGVYASITTYSDNRNDHWSSSFGRDYNHDCYTWDNRVYDLNTRLNDVMVTHNGDSAGNNHYGFSHGSSFIPIDGNRQIQMKEGHGHNNNNWAYTTLQVYGYKTA